MRKDKLEAFRLRKEGKTYNQISKILGVSKGTLSCWFKNADWSQKISESNSKSNYSPEKINLMHSARQRQLAAHYDLMRQTAAVDVAKYANDPLFVAGLMAYACEGDKLSNNLVRITNSDARVLLFFKKFIEKFYPDLAPKLKISVLLYPDLDTDLCLKTWSRFLAIPLYKFHKPVVIQGRHKTRRLQHGVATLIISSKSYKVRLLEAIKLTLGT